MTVRRRAFVWLAAGMLLVAAPLVAFQPAAAQTDVQFLNFILLADATAIKQQGGDQTQLGYPQAVASTAHTEADIRGPAAHALASSQWPGPLAGNVGSLTQAFGAPEDAGQLDYPVRAEARTGGTESQQLGGMSAEAGTGFALAIADGGSFDGGGSEFFSYGEVASTSRTEVLDDKVITIATARVSDVNIGGQIFIESVETEAIAETDGVTGTNRGSTVVSGMTVGGQPVSVDENGIRAGDSQNPSPADAVVQAIVDNVLSNFGPNLVVEIYVSKPLRRDEGAIQEYRSGSLVIIVEGNSPNGGGDGALLLGGANAFAQASQATIFIPPTMTTAPATTTTTRATTTTTRRTTTTSGATAAPTTTTTTAAPTTTTTRQQEVAAPPITVPTLPIVNRFDGIDFVMPFFILLGSLMAGRGLHLFHLSLRNQASAACLIDGDDQ